MGKAAPTAAPERARWPRLAASPHRQLRSLLPRGYAGFTEATEFLARTLPPSRIEKSRSNSFKTPPSLFPNLPRGTDLDGQIEEKQCGS